LLGASAVLTTFLNYRTVADSLSKSLARTAAESPVARESAHYLATIDTVKTIDDFLKNDRLFRFAMRAAGLGDMAYAKGFMRKLLQEGVDGSSALANKLADPRYKAFVKTFNFARYGTLTTTFAATRQGTVDQYVRQALEEKVGAQSEGARLALYFQRKAPEIANAYGILADPALLKVAQVALDILPATRTADIDTQARLIEAKLKVSDLQDPAKLDRFLQRFASLYDASNGTWADSTPTVLFGQASFGLSADLLMSLQSIRR
jgi:hypothetical protein